jgi:hypothetical protein
MSSILTPPFWFFSFWQDYKREVRFCQCPIEKKFFVPVLLFSSCSFFFKLEKEKPEELERRRKYMEG